MSSIFHRRPVPQANADQQPVPQSLGSTIDLRQHGREASRRLKLPYRHLLIEIAASTLDGSYEPYTPSSAENARLAATLADPSIGLLLAGSAGFITCYSLTPFGGAVVRALLQDLLAQQGTKVSAAPPANLPWEESGATAGGGLYGQHL